MFALIGSRALKHHTIYNLNRTIDNNTDWDFITTEEHFLNWYKHKCTEPVKSCLFKKNPNRFLITLNTDEKLSFDIENCKSNKLILDHWLASDTYKVFEVMYYVPTIAILFAIKKSHIISPHNWHKHIEDYYLIKSKLSYYDENIFKARRLETEARCKTKLNLNQDNKDFFGDKVVRLFDHDFLHKLIAYEDVPLHEKIKTDKSKAYIPTKILANLPTTTKIQLAREEIYVIALERYIIPKIDVPNAYKNALCKVSTILSKGYWRDFLLDNYPTLKTPDIDYVRKFKEQLIRRNLNVPTFI